MEANKNKKKQRKKEYVRVPPLETDPSPEMARSSNPKVKTNKSISDYYHQLVLLSSGSCMYSFAGLQLFG